MIAIFKRDGKTVASFEYLDLVKLEMQAMRYIHRKHSYSFEHAIRYEGYELVDETGKSLTSPEEPYPAKRPKARWEE